LWGGGVLVAAAAANVGAGGDVGCPEQANKKPNPITHKLANLKRQENCIAKPPCSGIVLKQHKRQKYIAADARVKRGKRAIAILDHDRLFRTIATDCNNRTRL
jgi:hypothetical protein